MRMLNMVRFTILFSVFMFASFSQASFDLKSVKKSQYYTGSNESIALSYVTLDKWLESLSQDQASNLISKGYIIDDRKLLEPLYKLTNKLLSGWPGKAPAIGVFILAGDAASVYGAQTVEGNSILINYGTLLNVDTDDELAAIMAHELSHVLLSHTNSGKYAKLANKLLGGYESLKQLKETYEASSSVKDAQGNMKIIIDPEVVSGYTQAAEQFKLGTNFYGAFHASFLSRGKETDADLLATELLIEGNFSPLGLKHSLERLTSSYDIGKLVSENMSASAESLVDLASAKAMNELSKLSDKPQKSGLFDMGALSDKAINMAKDKAIEAAFKVMKSAHPVPDKRREKFANYLDENATRKERNRATQQGIIASYKKSQAFDSVHRFDYASRANQARALGNNDVASNLGLKGISGKGNTQAYTRFVAYQVRKDQNKASSAVANLSRVNSFKTMPLSDLSEATFWLAEQKQSKLAKKAITERESISGLEPELYPAKIQLALNLKKIEKAKSLALDCIKSAKKNQSLESRCQKFGLVTHAEGSKSKGFFGAITSQASKIGSALPLN